MRTFPYAQILHSYWVFHKSLFFLFSFLESFMQVCGRVLISVCTLNFTPELVATSKRAGIGRQRGASVNS